MSTRVTIDCDYSDKTLLWCANESFVGVGTTDEVRKQARKAGWRHRGGKDYHGFHFKKKGDANA